MARELTEEEKKVHMPTGIVSDFVYLFLLVAIGFSLH
jgi:hypothetical protein